MNKVGRFKFVCMENRIQINEQPSNVKQMIKNLHMTDLSTFQDCRRRFFFDKILRITSKSTPRGIGMEYDEEFEGEIDPISPDNDPQFPMTFGSIGHKVLEDWYARKIPLLESFEKYGKNLRADFYELGQSLFIEYAKEWKDDFDKYEILLVETPITVTFTTTGLDYNYNPITINQDVELNLDLLVKSKENGAIFAMDHKFYKSMPSPDELRMRDQFTGYVTAIRTTGYNIQGVIVNILKKAVTHSPRTLTSGKLSKDKSQTTTYHRYKAEVDALAMGGADVTEYNDMLEFLRSNPHPTLRREIVLKTAAESKVWSKNLKPRLDDIIRAIRVGEDAFYPNPARQCLTCQFMRICQSQLTGGSGAGYMDQMYRHKDDTER